MRCGVFGATKFPHPKRYTFDLSSSIELHTRINRAQFHHQRYFHCLNINFGFYYYSTSRLWNAQQQQNRSHFAVYNTFFIKLNSIMEKIKRGNGGKIEKSESGSTLVVCFVSQPFNLMWRQILEYLNVYFMVYGEFSVDVRIQEQHEHISDKRCRETHIGTFYDIVSFFHISLHSVWILPKLKQCTRLNRRKKLQ